MKKIFTLAFSLAAMFLLADVYFGDKAAVTSLHSTTNFLVAILGSSSNAPVRLINPSNLLSGLSTSNYVDLAASNRVAVAAGSSITVTTNGSGGVTTYTIAGAGGSVLASNTVWLSQNGNDATGVRGDFSHPFLTPTGAVNAARAFDTIMVLPGTYGVKTVLFDVSTLLLRTNINWHFFSGAKITNDVDSVYAVFDDSQNSFPAGVGKVYITGDGEFVDDYSGSVVRVGIAGSAVDMTFRKMSDHVNVSAGILTLHNGTIEGSTSSDKACLTVQNASSTSVLDHVYIHYTNSVATGRTIYIKNGNTNTILRDCVLDAGPTATNTVLAVTVGTITVQGLVTMTVTNNPNVTFNPLIYQPPPPAGFAAVEVQTNGVRVGLVTNLNFIGATGAVSSSTAIIGGFSGGGGGSLTGTTNFLNLSVQAAKLPTTNYVGIDAGWQDWELLYYKTNAEGSVASLNGAWQFILPADYATNTLKVRIYSLLLSTNGPNSSNTIFRASVLRATPSDSTDLHTASFGSTVSGTTTWAASFNGTNKVQSVVINMSTTSALAPGDLCILKVDRDAATDTYGGVAALVGLQLEYTRP